MNNILVVAVAALISAAGAVSTPAADLGVSINIGEPGFYGRLDIGSFPRPQLIYQRPLVVERVPRGEVREPLYLHVPPGHERRWSQHCAQYNACGQPVYFVRDKWYRDTYVAQYRERNRGQERHGRDHDDNHDGDQDRGHGQPQH